MFWEFGMCVSGDKLVGEASRIVVAEACIQSLDLEVTENQVYEVNSVEVNFPWYSCYYAYTDTPIL